MGLVTREQGLAEMNRGCEQFPWCPFPSVLFPSQQEEPVSAPSSADCIGGKSFKRIKKEREKEGRGEKNKQTNKNPEQPKWLQTQAKEQQDLPAQSPGPPFPGSKGWQHRTAALQWLTGRREEGLGCISAGALVT